MSGTRLSGPQIGKLAFALVATLACALAAAALATEGQLTFVEAEKDGVGGVDGLFSPLGVSVSPDGTSVYVASISEDAVAVFARDPTSGALGFVEAEKNGVGGVDGLDGATSVSTSPDGRNVYVASQVGNSVAVFSREPSTGALQFVEAKRNQAGGANGLGGASDVSTSPDGMSVYVASKNDNAVVVFRRDPITGGLSFVEARKDGIGGVDGLDGASGISVSPDGRNVYVASSVGDAAAIFSRDPTSGALSFIEAEKDGGSGVDGLDGASGISVSPDGRDVYVASQVDSAVAVFARNPASGALSFVEARRDGVGGVDGLIAAHGVSVSPDGKSVYVAAVNDDALAEFNRNPTTGRLDFVEAQKDGVGGVEGLDAANDVAVAPDGRGVYVASFFDNAVAAFSREPDTTAPETTIIGGPSADTTEANPTFEFSSDDPGFTTGFECRLDGAQFQVCVSPARVGPLDLGPHEFHVRATDTAENADPSPATRGFTVAVDTKVQDPSVRAKRVQKVGNQVQVTVTAGAGEPVNLVAQGKIRLRTKAKKTSAGKKRVSFRLNPERKSTEGNQRTVMRLKAAKSDGRRILQLLAHGADLRADPSVTLTDLAGNAATEKRAVKLKLGKRKRKG